MPKKYPDEFKVKAIRRYEKGESIQSLCQELHISQSTLSLAAGILFHPNRNAHLHAERIRFHHKASSKSGTQA